jgi:hypothetical protein
MNAVARMDATTITFGYLKQFFVDGPHQSRFFTGFCLVCGTFSHNQREEEGRNV